MGKQENFRTVKEIKTESGLVGTITARSFNGREVFTYSVRKEYDHDGEVRYTQWFQKHHFEEHRKLLVLIEEAIEAEEDKSRAQKRVAGR